MASINRVHDFIVEENGILYEFILKENQEISRVTQLMRDPWIFKKQDFTSIDKIIKILHLNNIIAKELSSFRISKDYSNENKCVMENLQSLENNMDNWLKNKDWEVLYKSLFFNTLVNVESEKIEYFKREMQHLNVVCVNYDIKLGGYYNCYYKIGNSVQHYNSTKEKDFNEHWKDEIQSVTNRDSIFPNTKISASCTNNIIYLFI